MRLKHYLINWNYDKSFDPNRTNVKKKRKCDIKVVIKEKVLGWVDFIDLKKLNN